MANSDGRALALDGIRGIAAVGVLLYHCGLHLHAPWFVGHGSLAVDVFFCMSGFVVERAYGERLRTGWSAAAFARARLARLYPLYALGLALGIATDLALGAWKGSALPFDTLGCEVVLGVLLIPAMGSGPSSTFPLNPPSWSLFVEACANFVFVLLPRRFGTPVVVGMIAAAATLVTAAALAGLRLTYGGLPEILWLDLARGAFGFGVGVLMSRFDHGRPFAAVPRWPAPLVFGSLAALLLVPRGPVDAWFDPVAILLVCPALVALGVSSRTSPSIGRWSARAGALSYPLYIVHAPIVDAAANLAPAGAASPLPRALALTAAACIALALAAAIARTSEARRARTPAARTNEDAAPALTAVALRS